MKIAVMGDLHYSCRLTSADPVAAEARDAFYERYLALFLAIDADYYVSIGDLTHEGSTAEFAYVKNKIDDANVRGRFLHVLGNHDTNAHLKSDIMTLTGQRHRYGAIAHADAAIVLLDTARLTPEDWSGTLDEEQLDWLEEQIDLHKGKPLLVFGHHPPYATTARSTEEMMSIDPDIDIWSILSKRQGIGLYFNGHNHIHSIVQKEQWHFVQTAAVPDVPAVRIVTVTDTEVQVDTIEFADETLAEWISLFARHLFDYEAYPNAQGNAEDRRLVVDLSASGWKRVAQP